MVDLRLEADRHADMIRPHIEQTGGVESFFIANRTGHPPLAVPATFETVEAKEEGLELLRAMFQELGCTHVAWISEAWVAVSAQGLSDIAPRDRSDRTEALMIVVEDATGAQAVRVDPFAKSEGGIRWGHPFQQMQAERQLLSGPVDATLRARARAMAEQYRPERLGPTTGDAPSFLRRMTAWVSRRL